MITLKEYTIKIEHDKPISLATPTESTVVSLRWAYDTMDLVLTLIVDDTAPETEDTLVLLRPGDDFSEVGDVAHLASIGYHHLFVVVTDDPVEDQPQRRITHPALLEDGWGSSTPTDLTQLEPEPEKEN